MLFGKYSNNGVVVLRQIVGSSFISEGQLVGPHFVFMRDTDPNLPLATGSVDDMTEFLSAAAEVKVVERFMSVPLSQRDTHTVQDVAELKQHGICIAGAKEVIQTFCHPAVARI